LPHVEVVHDLDVFSYPFEDNSMEYIYASHCLEHLKDLIGAMKEIWRILVPDGLLCIIVPYFSSLGSFMDPTHRNFFTYHSFDYFDLSTTSGKYLNYQVEGVTFTIINVHLCFYHKFYNFIKIETFANRHPSIYEKFFAYTFPAHAIKALLKKS
jgi:SAM-dependent methyltransferase